jgi:NAD(P)-dependent dehydrogenase (short-subunit alcohol dehydrogenase family)
MAKIAVVTGGAGALGKAVCRAFAESGYDVHLTALNEKERKAYEGPGHVYEVDLADLESARRWSAKLPPVVHSAALLAGGFQASSLEDLTPDHVSALWKMNALTAFHALSALIPRLEKAGGASVVLVGSQAYEGAAGISAYASAKSAVVSLTRSAARELKSKKIRVNCLLPDIIDTPANRQAMPGADFETWAKPEEIAQVILLLCSDPARLINGAIIPVGR